MTLAMAESIVLWLSLYVLAGLIIGLIYLFGGAGRIDPAARGKGMPVRVRLIILPGVLGLWPLMLLKLLRQKAPPI